MRQHQLPTFALVAAFALAICSCGMRGGSSQTIISGLGGVNTGSSFGSLGGGGQTSEISGTKLIASAPGITPTTINIGTIQDISGPVPGLFQTSLDGVRAWVAYENAHGVIDGR